MKILHIILHALSNGNRICASQLSGGGGGGGKDPRKVMSDIKGENLGHGEKPDYFTIRCWVATDVLFGCAELCFCSFVGAWPNARLLCNSLLGGGLG